jgi:hypothetical protein
LYVLEKAQSNKLAPHNREAAGQAEDQRESLLFASKTLQDASFVPIAAEAV